MLMQYSQAHNNNNNNNTNNNNDNLYSAITRPYRYKGVQLLLVCDATTERGRQR